MCSRAEKVSLFPNILVMLRQRCTISWVKVGAEWMYKCPARLCWAHVSLELGSNAWSGICLQMSQPFSKLLKPLSCSAPTQLQDVTHLESWEDGKTQGWNIFLLVQETRERVRWDWRELTWKSHQRLWKVEASQQCFFLHQPWEHQSPLYSCSGKEFYKVTLSKPSWWSFLRARCFFYLE